ncbi:MAG: carbohydrate ABC transporter permease [Acutalibacteraceae bacterium]|nr:carbohydrate ABC transporter permease [Acutalibacteraceae bacterium]
MNKIKQYFKDKRGKKSAVKRYTRSTAGNVALVVFLVAGGLFSMLPLIYCVCTSLKPLDELLIFPPRFLVHRPTIGNYTILPDLMASLKVPLSRYIFNSIFTSLFTTVIYIFVALMAAYSISKATFKGRNAIFWAIQFALMFNGYTLAVPQYLIFSGLGLLDTYWIYILPPMASTMGVFLGKQYIEGYVPDALLEAAKIDGANQFRVFWSIVMPTIKPIWLTLLLFTFRDIWQTVPGGKIFSEELKILPQVVTQITAGGTARAGSAMAVTVIMMIPPIIVFLISQSSVAESMSSAGIKE